MPEFIEHLHEQRYVFDAASGGAQHCQIGNTALAENAIKDFLGEYGQRGKVMQKAAV